MKISQEVREFARSGTHERSKMFREVGSEIYIDTETAKKEKVEASASAAD